MTVGLFMLYFLRTPLNEAYTANVPFAKSVRASICCPEFYSSLKISSDFAFFISRETISHFFFFFVAIQDMLSIQSTLCSFFDFTELNHFSDCMVYVQNERYFSQVLNHFSPYKFLLLRFVDFLGETY